MSSINVSDANDTLYGGLADDTLNGGDGNDILEGDGGLDAVSGGAGNDIIYFAAIADSTGKTFDTVDGFSFAEDKFHFSGGVSALDSTKNNGKLDNPTFNADLASAFSTLASHHAVLFKPNSGDYDGHTLLIIGQNKFDGFQTDKDFVIDLVDSDNLGALSVDNFI